MYQDSPEARDKVLNYLYTNIVDVTFTKVDGSQRVLKATLNDNLIQPYERLTNRSKEVNPDVQSVWSIDDNAFRSFRWDSVKMVQVLNAV